MNAFEKLLSETADYFELNLGDLERVELEHLLEQGNEPFIVRVLKDMRGVELAVMARKAPGFEKDL